jgi:hypothetical protein
MVFYFLLSVSLFEILGYFLLTIRDFTNKSLYWVVRIVDIIIVETLIFHVPMQQPFVKKNLLPSGVKPATPTPM